MSLRNYKNLRKTLPSTFIYEPILMKICMNAKIVKTQIFILLCMSSEVIEGHIEGFFFFKSIFLRYLICLKSNLIII